MTSKGMYARNTPRTLHLLAISAFAFKKSGSIPGSPGSDSPIYNDSEPTTPAANSELIKIVSRFTPVDDNAIPLLDSQYYGLMIGQTLVFRGQYQITVLKGAISLLGAVLHSSPARYTVYAPQSHALPLIECINVQDSSLLEQTSSPEEIEFMYSKFQAVVQIESIRSGFEQLSTLVPLYKSLWTVSPPHSHELVLTAPETTLIHNAFNSWHDLCSKVLVLDQPAPIILVTGSKSSGKSSFARFLANFILSRVSDTVHYLELDPGQPEYCPPGTLSLHRLVSDSGLNFGPSFTHCDFHSIVKAHSIGDTSPKDLPSHFISYAQDLIKTYKSTLTTEETPLIINTPGWTRGMGLELIYEISSASRPTMAVHLGPDDSRLDVQSVIGPDTPYYPLESIAMYLRTPSKYSASDLRTLQIMSYLHKNHDFTNHLTDITPYQIPYIQNWPTAIAGIGILDSDGIFPDDCATCINGTILAIVAVDKDVPIPTVQTSEGLPWINSSDLDDVLNPGHCQCVGYGVVQSIDEANKSVRFLTPIHMDIIDECFQRNKSLVLVRGRLQLPLWELYNPSLKVKAPYLSECGDGRVRKHISRRGQ